MYHTVCLLVELRSHRERKFTQLFLHLSFETCYVLQLFELSLNRFLCFQFHELYVLYSRCFVLRSLREW